MTDTPSLTQALQEKFAALGMPLEAILVDGRKSSVQDRILAVSIQHMVIDEVASGRYPPSANLAREATAFLCDINDRAGNKIDAETRAALQNGKYGLLGPLERAAIHDALGITTDLRVALHALHQGRLPDTERWDDTKTFTPKTKAEPKPKAPPKPKSPPPLRQARKKSPPAMTMPPASTPASLLPRKEARKATPLTPPPAVPPSVPQSMTRPVSSPPLPVDWQGAGAMKQAAALISDEVLTELGILQNGYGPHYSDVHEIKRRQQALWGMAKQGQVGLNASMVQEYIDWLRAKIEKPGDFQSRVKRGGDSERSF